MYELVKGCGIQNDLNGLLDNLLKEYFDVFPIDLLRMPPTKEVDHAIDLDCNAKPIIKTPYCHCFMENEEMEQQLSDILGKKYIKPISQIYKLHRFVLFKHECHALFKHRSHVHNFCM